MSDNIEPTELRPCPICGAKGEFINPGDPMDDEHLVGCSELQDTHPCIPAGEWYEKRIAELEEELSQNDRDETERENIRLGRRIQQLTEAGDGLEKLAEYISHHGLTYSELWDQAKEALSAWEKAKKGEK